MKKTKLSIFSFGLVVLSTLMTQYSCNKGTVNTSEQKVAVTHQNISFQIPINNFTGDNDSITSFYHKMNMDSFVKSFGSYDTSHIRSVKLTSCFITFNNGDSNNNVRNFHSQNIGITSGSNSRIYRIATFTDIVDTNKYDIQIPSYFDPNLASYFKDDSVRYRLYGNFRRPTTKDLECTANLSFDLILKK